VDAALRVVVTAGAQGVGRGVVDRFLTAGAHVHVCDIDSKALSDLKAAHPEVGTTLADVSQSQQVKALFREVLDVMGGVDVLVNNAGIGGPRGPVESLDDGEWEQTIAVNLNGMFYCVKNAVPPMKAQGGGSIINISTSSVRTGLPLRTAYIASKAGVMGLTLNLARELGPANIRCNAILPGLIGNARGRALVQRAADEQGRTFADIEAEALKFNSLRTWIHPREIGDTAVFLASEPARHITGQYLGVCGNVEWEG
jgi:NAD(P)-dependent dehydrogenase (short-subunit alcohol dehydrogenase family)